MDIEIKRLQDAMNFLYDFDDGEEYQKELGVVLDTLNFSLVRVKSLRENLEVLQNIYIDKIRQQNS